ncbi:MAG: virulence factor SrfB [SAR116 cluster bacterium]|nr:virulence factor SrfB [Paracoccaceae bacterium]RCL79686.1 MAG: virulence factor SrfB [SAR116 cluster bacterium]HBQ22197.1 virulence factor SrfB [Alphaproteobacteria bacterium]|tara:strand:- start:1848 stop:4913 length:3066 start_codon:yes stop_codon:yes gene_type:complete
MIRKSKNNLRKLVEWKDEVTLVPYSGVQMLDAGFNLDNLKFRPKEFIERTTGHQGDDAIRSLLPLTGDDEIDAKILDAETPEDDRYAIKASSALEPFLDMWVPAPVLRLRPGLAAGGTLQYDAGPSTWAMIRLVELSETDNHGNSHRVQLALDTELMADEQLHYLAPSLKDAKDEREFRLVTHVDDMEWFLCHPESGPDGTMVDHQRWVTDWLSDLFLETIRKRRKGREIRPEDMPYKFEHWARYITFLEVIGAGTNFPAMRMVDVVSDDAKFKPIDVDLVLDIGNSRTCGILIESIQDEPRVNLHNSYVLEPRDLSRPEYSYPQLLESRVEFSDVNMGREDLLRRAGRANAFLWPSMVRVGPEAMRMTKDEEGTETVSGLSSPKRYLWDEQPRDQDWRFQNNDNQQSLPVIARSSFRFLNAHGDVISQVQEEEKRRLRRRNEVSKEPAIRPRFSRSAMFGFMLTELFAHALVQINDPAGRAGRTQSSVPRRLRKIILTLPSATPVQEQAIIRSRAEGALRLIWSILKINPERSPISALPELVVDWDEASCSQLVYLYTQITQRFGGDLRGYMELMGRERNNAPSLRLATIDVGGGTTDLMITTYGEEGNQLLKPQQNFREGFRTAGDDIIAQVVADIVLPEIRRSMEHAGGRHCHERIMELFGGDYAGMDEQSRQARRQYGLRVLTPLAVAVLEACELAHSHEQMNIKASDVLGMRGEDDGASIDLPRSIINYLDGPARSAGAENWTIGMLQIDVERGAVDAIIRNCLAQPIGNMAEVIAHLGCDVVLLTGRPSRLPAVRNLVQEMLVVSPDRLISMHRFRVDGWYPYRDVITNQIGDPKSTVAVGGMLLSLAKNRLANFKFDTDKLLMKSTARHVGVMNPSGMIPVDQVIFADIDLDKESSGQDVEATIQMYAANQIGFRQLKLARWTTTPLYRMDFANAQIANRPMPLKVTIRRRGSDPDAEGQEEILKAEAMKEALEISEVEDAEGSPCKQDDVRLRLHTLGLQNDYWLDTGIFRMA